MNKIQKTTLLAFLIVMILTTTVLAETRVGDQTFTNRGVGVHIDSKGNITGEGVKSVGGGKIEVTTDHKIPLPPGTTQASIDYGKGAIGNITDHDRLNKNGHEFKNGADVLKKVGDLMPNEVNIKSQTVYTDKNGNSWLMVTTVSKVTEAQVKANHFASNTGKALAQDLLKQPGDMNAKIAILASELRQSVDTTNPALKWEQMARNLLLNPYYYTNQDFMMMNLVGIVTVDETQESELEKEKEKKKNQMPSEGKGPTTCVASDPYICLDSYREVFLYTYTTTTDLPTPPTRNHGPCPTHENAGFKEWDSAWGENYFPKAGDGEHWKYWDATNVNKGYNKSIHYETRGVVPGATNPANILNGRPVETTQWTPISDAKYETFLAEPVGKIDYTWVDNSKPTRDGYEIKN